MIGKLNPHEIDAAFKETVSRFNERAKEFVGRQVKIVGFYNGQAAGRSRKNIEGTMQTIAEAYLSDCGGLMIFLKDYRYGCPALAVDQWELIE